jgi:hypothetical protein
MQITPGPSRALFNSTEALPFFPYYYHEEYLSFHQSVQATSFLDASSFPLRIASGISVAFPKHTPTWSVAITDNN